MSRGAQPIVDSLYWPLSHLHNPRNSACRMNDRDCVSQLYEDLLMDMRSGSVPG